MFLRNASVAASVLALLAFSVPAGVSAQSCTTIGSGNHCVAKLEHIRPGSDEARVVSETCFPTFVEALREATGGAVNLPITTSTYAAMAFVDTVEGPIGAASSFLIGEDWDNSNYDDSAGTKLWEASADCGPGVAWNISSINSDWQNRISSAKGKSSCDRFYHFEDPGYEGAQRNCLPNCATFGAMNDRTRSLQFKP